MTTTITAYSRVPRAAQKNAFFFAPTLLVVILCILCSLSTVVAARAHSRCPAHCTAEGWGPGGRLRLPECYWCDTKPQRPAVARATSSRPASLPFSSSYSRTAVHRLHDVERAPEPIDIPVAGVLLTDEAKGKGKGKKTKNCAKWCRWIPSMKWIPDCKDCEHEEENLEVQTKLKSAQKNNMMTKIQNAGLITLKRDFLADIRAAAPPSPECPWWCEMVPGKKAKQWIPKCQGCVVDYYEYSPSK